MSVASCPNYEVAIYIGGRNETGAMGADCHRIPYREIKAGIIYYRSRMGHVPIMMSKVAFLGRLRTEKGWRISSRFLPPLQDLTKKDLVEYMTNLAAYLRRRFQQDIVYVVTSGGRTLTVTADQPSKK